MNNCPECGAPVSDGAAFCTSCGTQFSQAQPQQPYQQQAYQQQAYQQPGAQPANVIYVQQQQAPARMLSTTRGLLKYILLSLVTFGIYGLVAMSSVSNDINLIASRYDGKKTMHFCLLTFIVLPITFGIAGLVWYNNISARIGQELMRRGIDYKFSASDFWLWDILGACIIVGPFIYMHKLFVAMNKLSEHYNMYG